VSLKIFRGVIPLDDLIDRESKRFKDRGMQFMVFDIEEELLSDPLLLKNSCCKK
jgi:arsenate reductase